MYAESFPSKLKAARDKTGLSQRSEYIYTIRLCFTKSSIY